MKEIVAEITRLARRSPDVNQRSGVSVRASIADYESLLANALRRSIRLGESDVVPRISDLPYVIPTISGKVEFETVEDGKEEQIIEKLIQSAVVTVFNRYFNVVDLEEIVTRFKAGLSTDVCDQMPSDALREAHEVRRGPAARRRQARHRREPRAHRQRDGVRARGSAPEQAPQQGPRRRQGAIPRLSRKGSTMVAFRYSEWDGTQEIPPLDADEVLEALTDDLMNFGDLQHAMRNLLQRGMRGQMGNRLQGLRDLLQQLRQQRRNTLDKYNLSSVMDDIKQRLDEILEHGAQHYRAPAR